MFSTMNNNSFEHSAYKFRVPLLEINLSVRIAENLFRGSCKWPEVLYVWQYTTFVSTIDFRIAQYRLQLRLHEFVKCSFHVNQSGCECHR